MLRLGGLLLCIGGITKCQVSNEGSHCVLGLAISLVGLVGLVLGRRSRSALLLAIFYLVATLYHGVLIAIDANLGCQCFGAWTPSRPWMLLLVAGFFAHTVLPTTTHSNRVAVVLAIGSFVLGVNALQVIGSSHSSSTNGRASSVDLSTLVAHEIRRSSRSPETDWDGKVTETVLIELRSTGSDSVSLELRPTCGCQHVPPGPIHIGGSESRQIELVHRLPPTADKTLVLEVVDASSNEAPPMSLVVNRGPR